MLVRSLVCVSLILTCALSAASDTWQGKLYIEGFTGKALVPFLGSEDPRSTHGFGLGIFRPGLRMLRYRGFVPQTILQVYYQRSTSPGASEQPPNGTDAFGLMMISRYTGPRHNGLALYLDLGLGIQYADMRTVDLSGRASFTPVLGLGVSYSKGQTELFAGARLMHISNAALQGNNQGQNQLMLTLGVRF